MRGWKRGAWVTLIVGGLAAMAAACGGASNEGRSHGVVKTVDVEARKLTLDHEDIPGLMKGMTMTFDVAPDVALEGLQSGVELEFRVKEEGGVYTVTEIRRSP